MREKNNDFIFKRDSYTESDYEMYREDNDLDPKDYTENQFYEWMYDMESMDFDDMLDNLHYTKIGKYRCLIEGTIGTWRGKREICQTDAWGIKEAILRCVDGADMVDSVKVVCNSIEVVTIHHDGRNYFTIHILSELGAERFDRHGQVSMENYQNFVKLPKGYPYM